MALGLSVEQARARAAEIKAALEKADKAAANGGFKLITPEATKPRLIFSIRGLDKQGKNHFCFTAPGPIGVQSMDIGLEGMVEKFISGKQISVAEYALSVQPHEASAEQVATAAEPVWERFVREYRDGLTRFRTLIWDTGDEVWELLRLCRFGKLGQVMPHHYGPVNAEFRSLIREAYEHNVNFGIIQRLKAEWKEGAGGKANKTGNYEVAGFKDMPFLVQANLHAWRDGEKGPFHVTVLNCRANPDLGGMDFEQPGCGFADIAMLAHPESKPTDWE